jgi:DNA-directed RNA polymerase specialized sigma24 family protein
VDEEEFRRFVQEAEPRLHRALVARFGWEVGREAVAEALGYAWEHWRRVKRFENPVGYLFRVGSSRVRGHKERPIFARASDGDEPRYEPTLSKYLAQLPDRQRVAVVLVHGYGWTTQEVADLLNLRATTVQTHVSRALSKLREQMEVQCDG